MLSNKELADELHEVMQYYRKDKHYNLDDARQLVIAYAMLKHGALIAEKLTCQLQFSGSSK